LKRPNERLLGGTVKEKICMDCPDKQIDCHSTCLKYDEKGRMERQAEKDRKAGIKWDYHLFVNRRR